MVGFFLADALNLSLFQTSSSEDNMSWLFYQLFGAKNMSRYHYQIHEVLHTSLFGPHASVPAPQLAKKQFKNKVKGQNLYKKTLQVTK